MKRTKLLGLALIAIMTSFSACTNETEEVLAQESEIKLTSEIIPASRVTSLDYQSTQIVEGQQVGVTIAGAKSEHKNVAWTVGTDGALTNTDDAVYYSGNNTATITAYHPYNSAWTGTSHAFSVNTDQSDETNYRNSDLLWATASSSKTDKAVGLIFAHKLAKVNVTLTSTDIADLSGATISICGTNIATNFNPTTGELSAATANVQEIKAGVTTTEYTASAIVVPQTVVSGTKFIKVAQGGKTFYYTLAADKELKSGYSHNYTLTVKEKELEIAIESDKITDWTDENGNTGDAEEETSLSKNIILETAGTLSTFISETEKQNITSVTISGPLNENDLNFISEMSSSQGNLSYINLSQSTFENNKIELYGGKLKSLIIPNSIDTLDLQCENLSSVNIPDDIKSLRIINNKVLENINIPSGADCIDLDNCSGLTSVNIPQGIEYIAYNVNHNVVPDGKKWINLAGCSSLSYVSIPNSVTTIGFNAFANCSSLTYVSIPNSVTKFENQAFTNSGLISISIPNSVSEIGYMAFCNCNKLKEVHCHKPTPLTIDEYVFHNVPLSTCTLYVPTGSKSTYQSANYWKNFGKIIEE